LRIEFASARSLQFLSGICFLLIQAVVCRLQQFLSRAAIGRVRCNSYAHSKHWLLFRLAGLPESVAPPVPPLPGSASIKTNANSSPPYLAAISIARQCSLITFASLFSARFPARCPFRSLICFSLSKSGSSTANILCDRSARFTSRSSASTNSR